MSCARVLFRAPKGTGAIDVARLAWAWILVGPPADDGMSCLWADYGGEPGTIVNAFVALLASIRLYHFHPDNRGGSREQAVLAFIRNAGAIGASGDHIFHAIRCPPFDSGATMSGLQSIDRVSEVLFGLIMVLTFTGTLSVATAGHEDVRTMLIGALGCNLAWGLIDAVFYLMGALAEKGKNLETYRAVRSANDPQQAQRLVAGALPPIVASVLEPKELEGLRERLMRLPEPPERASLSKDDWLEAVHVFLLVFLSTLPVTLPFLFISDAGLALRISDGIAILLLFVAGLMFGRITGRRPLYVGIAMVIVGLVLVGMTIALGG